MPLTGTFVYADPSTWRGGLKVVLIAMLISFVVAFIVTLRGKWQNMLCFICLPPAIYYISYYLIVCNKSFIIGLLLNFFTGVLLPLALLGGWIPALAFTMGEELTEDDLKPTTKRKSKSSVKTHISDKYDSEGMASLLRMPHTIRDEYGNVYTQYNIDSNGKYVTYTGPYGPIDIYAKDVNIFSASADGHYFTW